MSAPHQTIPLLCLNGQKRDGLYQLGLLESKNYLDNLEKLERLVQTQVPMLNKWLRSLGEKLLHSAAPKSLNRDLMATYAEGLGIAPQRMMLAYFLPELASSMSKWIPGLPLNLLGCSSFLCWSEKYQAPLHARILDFPLVGSFDTHERVLVTRFDDELAVASLSSAGLPFHSLSAINEAGVTMAIHQKFTPALDLSGESIFTLSSDLISKVTNERDLENLLKNKRSITTWNLIFTFPNGKAVSLDLSGTEATTQRFNLKENSQYLCNFNHGKWPASESILPLGFDAYNQMRQSSGQKKMAKFDTQKSSEKTLLKTISELKLQKQGRSPFELDCLTPSSLHAVVMNGKDSSLTFNLGPAPKIYSSQIATVDCHLSDKRTRPVLKTSGTPKETSKTDKGYRHLIMAQMSYDEFDKHSFYHHLQMAISQFRGYQIQSVCEFFLSVANFLDLSHSKERNLTLGELRRTRPHLPPYLAELCSLFIWRLERLLDIGPTITESDFTYEALKKIFILESKIPPTILYNLLKKTTVLRLDLLDVIQPHLRS